MVVEDMSTHIRNLRRGLSDTVALAILLGVAMALSVSFLSYMQSDYSIQQNLLVIQRVIEHERLSTIVRLINSSKGSIALLFRRLDTSNKIWFMLFNGSSYINCSDVVRDVVGGRIINRYMHRVDDVTVVSRDTIYSFKYYARAKGYPDTGYIEICELEIDKNAVLVLQLAKELEPVAKGYNKVVVHSNNRVWRLYGSIEFRVAFLGDPRGTHISVNGSWYQLKEGDIVRVDVNTRIGKIDLTPQQLPNGQIGAWILSFNVFAERVYINNALLERNVNVEIKSEVAIDIDSLRSTLAIEIMPTPPGFVRVTYGGSTLVDYWNNSDYIKVVDWKIDSSTQMVLQLDSNNLHAEGIARAVYIGSMPDEAKVDRLSILVVTYINNVPHLVEEYDYKFS